MIDILAYILLGVFIFIPTLIARCRHVKNIVACFWINVLLGWSFLIWLPLLVWSIMTNRVQDDKDLQNKLKGIT